MEVKMFAGTGNVYELQQEINDWLSSHKVKVDSIKQSYTCDDKACYVLISVWYQNLANITEI